MDRFGAAHIPRWPATVVSYVILPLNLLCIRRLITSPNLAPSHSSLKLSTRGDILSSGKGKWKEIATMIPTRSTVQVKTHAQMVMKRVAAGDDTFFEYYLDLLVSPGSIQIDESKVVVKKESLRSTRRKNASETHDGLSQMDQQAAIILYQMAH